MRLVTGGNRGIGLEVVRLLSDLGVDVFLGSRDLDAGGGRRERWIPGITPVRIDVADPASVGPRGTRWDLRASTYW